MSYPYIQDDGAKLDYGFDWHLWLGTDTIATSTWTVPAGLTASLLSFTPTTTTIWLAGGTLGQSYSVVNQITTAAGRTDERTIVITVQDT